MRLTFLVLLLAATFSFSLHAARPDVQGSRDHALISRYGNSVIIGYQASDHEAFRLPLSGLKRQGNQVAMDNFLDLEGELTKIAYELEASSSTLKVFRNYEKAMLDAGFQSLFQCAGDGCGMQDIWDEALDQTLVTNGKQTTIRYMAAKRSDNGKEVYVGVYVMEKYSGKVFVAVNVLEAKQMQTGLVSVDADAMIREIEVNGKVAVYGIYFEHDKAELGEKSYTVLEQIRRLLELRQELNLYVVGHTDDTGDQSHNLDLSNRRAQAVVTALTHKFKVAGNRLMAFGAGPYAPVASNSDEAGRSRNRRVELVRRLQ